MTPEIFAPGAAIAVVDDKVILWQGVYGHTSRGGDWNFLEADHKAGALKTYEKALAVFYRKYPDAEPPYELWKNHTRLLADLPRN